MSQYFPKPYERSGIHVKNELDLSKYTTESDLKKATAVDRSIFDKKFHVIVSLKRDADESGIDKFKTVPVDLNWLRNEEDNDVVKKTEYNKLVTRVNAINTCRFVSEI